MGSYIYATGIGQVICIPGISVRCDLSYYSTYWDLLPSIWLVRRFSVDKQGEDDYGTLDETTRRGQLLRCRVAHCLSEPSSPSFRYLLASPSEIRPDSQLISLARWLAGSPAQRIPRDRPYQIVNVDKLLPLRLVVEIQEGLS
jgi:hypothetical protein